MSFPYTTGIPNPPDDPSVDVPFMQINCNTINSWTQTDHVGFNNSQGGQHKQVTFNANIASPSVPSGAVAIETTGAGTASPAAQSFFTNANATFQLSSVCAWGYVSGTSLVAGFPLTTTITNPSAGSYVITLPSGIVTGTSYAILATPQLSSGAPAICCTQPATSTIFNVFTFKLTPTVSQTNTTFNFIVLQV